MRLNSLITPFVFGLSLTPSLLACSGEGDVELRAGVRRIFTYDNGGIDLSYGPFVDDVATEGQRIALLLRHKVEGDLAFDASMGSSVLLSEDDGATWSHHFVDVFYNYFGGIAFHDGVLLGASNGYETSGGAPLLTVYALDPDTSHWEDIASFPDGVTWAVRDGELVALVAGRVPQSRELVWHRREGLDWANAAVSTGTMEVPPEAPDCLPRFWTAGEGSSTRFETWCSVSEPAPIRRCEFSFEAVPIPESPWGTAEDPARRLTYHCADASRLETLDWQTTFVTKDLKVDLHRDGGQTVASRFVSTDAVHGRLELTPVGPGAPLFTRRELFQRNTFADLVPLVREVSPDVFVTDIYRYDKTRGSFVDAGLPTRPCPAGAPCGWRVAEQVFTQDAPPRVHVVRQRHLPVAAVKRGDSRYRIFYLIEEESPSTLESRVSILMEDATSNEPLPPVVAPPTGPSDPEPLPDDAPGTQDRGDLVPEDAAGGPWDTLCAALVGCFPDFRGRAGVTPQDCLDAHRAAGIAQRGVPPQVPRGAACHERQLIWGWGAVPLEEACTLKGQLHCLETGGVGWCDPEGRLHRFSPDPCLTRGGRCVGVVDGQAVCRNEGLGLCGPEVGETCAEGGEGVCHPDGRETCWAGGSCQDDAEGAARGEPGLACLTAYPACAGYAPTATSTRRFCHGDGTIGRCRSDGFGVFDRSCESLLSGFECVSDGLEDVTCRPRTTTCTEASHPLRCEDDFLSYCYEGSLRYVDCQAEYLKCGPNARGVLACVHPSTLPEP